MRISDWRSDVCPSDLPEGEQLTDATDDCGSAPPRRSTPAVKLDFKIARAPLETELRSFGDQTGLAYAAGSKLLAYRWGSAVRGSYTPVEAADRLLDGTGLCGAWLRSEEHTSELQSLMRISYAVFCLKKQKKTPNKQTE